MTTHITPLKVWMRSATPAERKALVEAVGTSDQYLHHLSAGEDKRYHREAKPALAAAIERETLAMRRPGLEPVYRTDLNGTCRECSFARKCLGERATASEFPVLGAKP